MDFLLRLGGAWNEGRQGMGNDNIGETIRIIDKNRERNYVL